MIAPIINGGGNSGSLPGFKPKERTVPFRRMINVFGMANGFHSAKGKACYVKALGLLIAVVLLSVACSRSQGVGRGQRIDFTDRLHLDRNAGQFAQVFIPDYFRPQGDYYDVVFHLHSASWAAENEVYRARANVILFNIHLGAFSSPYQAYFSHRERFAEILDRIRQSLIEQHIVPDSAKMRYLILTSFSAGYAGVREILKSDGYYRRIAALHLADGLHSNSDPATMDIQMKDFVRFAADALDKRKIFRLTHSSIPTSGYKSTTETADYLLRKLGLQRRPVHEQDEIGTMYSRCDSGYFHLRAYLGTTAHDHLQHLYAMHLMLQATMAQLSNATGLTYVPNQRSALMLQPNYPNPFNSQTIFRYFLPQSGLASLRIINALGQVVAVPLNGFCEQGWHLLRFRARGLSSGMYWAVLRSGSDWQKQTMILLK